MLRAPENTTSEKSGNLSRQLCWPQHTGCTRPRGDMAQPLWDCPAPRWWAQEVAAAHRPRPSCLCYVPGWLLPVAEECALKSHFLEYQLVGFCCVFFSYLKY